MLYCALANSNHRSPDASWHTDYRDTAYVFIGGLPFELSEGDLLTIFSQYGEPTYLNLVRDKETGKSKGFAFLKYEDQRSTDLAVDNLGGSVVMGRTLKVDHTRYKRKEGEEEMGVDLTKTVEGAGEEGNALEGGRRKRRRTSESGSEKEEQRPMLKEEVELQKLLIEHDDDDPMKAFLVEEKKEEVQLALARIKGGRKEKQDKKHSHHHRSRKDRDDADGEGKHSRRRKDGERRKDSEHKENDSRRRRGDGERRRSRSRDAPRKDNRERDSEHRRRRDDTPERSHRSRD